jgi:YD repeat-containing protein
MTHRVMQGGWQERGRENSWITPLVSSFLVMLVLMCLPLEPARAMQADSTPPIYPDGAPTPSGDGTLVLTGPSTSIPFGTAKYYAGGGSNIAAKLCMFGPNGDYWPFALYFGMNVDPGICPRYGFYGNAAIWIISPTCPAGYSLSAGLCNLADPSKVQKPTPAKILKNQGPASCGYSFALVGNPIHSGTGNKTQQIEDYSDSGAFLTLTRSYNSTSTEDNGIGIGWNFNWKEYAVSQAPTYAYVTRPGGKKYLFKLNVATWIPDADVTDQLQRVADANNATTGWRYLTAEGDIEVYDASGNLVSLTNRVGQTWTLTRTGTTMSVADPFGHTLVFGYDAQNNRTVTSPNGGIYTYRKDSNNNLASIAYPDGTTQQYLYEDARFPHSLTGIIDENGNRYASWSYDAKGKANASWHGDTLYADKTSLSYVTDANGNPVTTTVTDALNTARIYNFQTILGVVKSTGQSQPGGSGCGASSSAVTYDANGNVASRTDFNGNRTDYSYDLSRNLETSRTEGLTTSGATTPATRTITTAWHPTLRLPVQITNGNQQTSYTYNPQGDITQKTVKDLAANTSRSWSTAYTYSAAVPGVLVQKVEDGPRTDVSDLTTYDYYPADAACPGGNLGCRGQLKQITDALGHITRLTRYSAHGQIEQLSDPNGLSITMTYDSRQRLTSIATGSETTTYSYDLAGQVTRVTGPDGAYLAYSYDAAHRLIKTQDDLGNTLTYTLDAMGNKLKEEAHDPGGQLARSQSRVYDALSRLQSLILPQ